MIIKRATALLISTTMLAGAAIAQSTTPAPAPSTSAPAAPMAQSTTPAASSAMSGQFMTQQSQDQFRASKFVGLSIYSQEGERIGDINEVLLDGSGASKGVVIGVGGFLGIGEKNVALPWSAVEWSMTRPTPTTTASTPAATTASSDSRTAMGSNPSTAGMPAVTATGAGSMGASGTTSSTTGGTGGAMGAANATSNRSPAEQAAINGYPDHGKIRMSKAELQSAPDFKWYGDTRR